MAKPKKTGSRAVDSSCKGLACWLPATTAVLTIGCVEAYALSKGINGVALTSSIAAIAGIAGFKLRDVFGPKVK